MGNLFRIFFLQEINIKDFFTFANPKQKSRAFINTKTGH